MTTIQISQWNLKHRSVALLAKTSGMLCKVRCASLQGAHSSNPAPGSVPSTQEEPDYLVRNELMNPILMYCDIFTLTGILCQVYDIKDFLYL